MRQPEFGPVAAANPVGTPIAHGTAGDGKRGTFPEISGLIVAASQHLILVAVLAVGLAAGLAYATTQFVSEEYLATSFVKVRQREDFLLFKEQSRAEDAAVVRSQKELVLRHQTLTEALKHESVQQISDSLPEGSRVDWLRSKLKIDMQSGAEVLAITASHESAEVAQILVNAVTEAYLDDVADRAAAERERRKTELQRTAEIINGRLSEKWGQLEILAGNLGTGSLQTLGLREQIQMQGYREYAQQLRAAQLHRNQLETQLAEEKLRQQAPPSISEAELYSAIQRHPEVVSQRSRIDFLNNKIREIKEIVSDENSPRIQALIDDRNFYQEQLQALLADLQPKMREQMQQQQLAQRSHMKDELTTQIALKRDEEKFLSQMLSDMEGDLETDSGGSGVQLEMLRHEIDRQEQLADSIWHSLEKLKIEEQARPRISLIELANLPDHVSVKSLRRFRELKQMPLPQFVDGSASPSTAGRA